MARKPKATQKRSSVLVVRVLRHPHAEGLELPAYQSDGAAGLDLVAAVDGKKPIKLARGGFAAIPTGLAIELPPGFEAQVRPRSGMAAKHGVTVLNSPGTIDCDYRGEIKVLLVNLGRRTFLVKRGERIAQMIIAPVTRAALAEATSIGDTARGAGGFGSTGTSEVRSPRQPAARKPISAKGQKRNALPRKDALTKKPRSKTARSTRPRR